MMYGPLSQILQSKDMCRFDLFVIREGYSVAHVTVLGAVRVIEKTDGAREGIGEWFEHVSAE